MQDATPDVHCTPQPAASQTPVLSFDMAALYADMARMRAERAEEVRQERAELIELMKAAGIEAVEAHYDAYGDSGNIETVTLLPELPAEDQPSISVPDGELPLQASEPRIPESVMTRLQDLLWSTVYALHPGFENNEGGYGDISWDIAENSMSIEHSERFVDVNCYSYEGV